jgi:hypothetical protein
MICRRIQSAARPIDVMFHQWTGLGLFGARTISAEPREHRLSAVPPLEMKAIADGDAAQGIKGFDPVLTFCQNAGSGYTCSAASDWVVFSTADNEAEKFAYGSQHFGLVDTASGTPNRLGFGDCRFGLHQFHQDADHTNAQCGHSGDHGRDNAIRRRTGRA